MEMKSIMLSIVFSWHGIWFSKPHESRKAKPTKTADLSKRITGLDFTYSLYSNALNPTTPLLTFVA